MSLRFSPASFLGFAPLGSGNARAKRADRKPAARVEPTLSAGWARSGGTYPIAVPAQAEGAHGVDVNKLLAALKVAPDLPLIEWDGDRVCIQPCHTEAPEAADSLRAEDPHTFEPRRRKIRDRYVSARFPGVARGCADLESAARVVKSARLYFEEDEVDAALELLQLAIEEAPHESSLWLARLEILFLARDRERFAAAARAFQQAHPAHESWPEVARLGRAIAPEDSAFGEGVAPRDHEHYGPWPHLPNWIQAPWDLTAEVVAADFHRAMTRLAAGAVPAA